MVKVALFVRLQAEPGKEEEVKGFLESAVALANREATTPVSPRRRISTSDSLTHPRRRVSPGDRRTSGVYALSFA